MSEMNDVPKNLIEYFMAHAPEPPSDWISQWFMDRSSAIDGFNTCDYLPEAYASWAMKYARVAVDLVSERENRNRMSKPKLELPVF